MAELMLAMALADKALALTLLMMQSATPAQREVIVGNHNALMAPIMALIVKLERLVPDLRDNPAVVAVTK